MQTTMRPPKYKRAMMTERQMNIGETQNHVKANAPKPRIIN